MTLRKKYNFPWKNYSKDKFGQDYARCLIAVVYDNMLASMCAMMFICLFCDCNVKLVLCEIGDRFYWPLFKKEKSMKKGNIQLSIPVKKMCCLKVKW